MATFSTTQQLFINHIKDPDNNPVHFGIEDRRLKIYRELFFNNILGFLNTGFPVLKSLYSNEAWSALARCFFANHNCRSPYFVDISKEFVEFLSNEYSLTDEDYPFIQELAHYEWLELDISVRKLSSPQVIWDGKSEVDKFKLSEAAQLVSYRFPVHQISTDFIPDEGAEPTYLVVYRNSNDSVNFTLVNEVTAHLLNIVSQVSFLDVNQSTSQMSEALPQIDCEVISAGTIDTLKELLSLQVLVTHLD